MALATAPSSVDLAVGAQDFRDLLRAYADANPPSVAAVVAERDELISREGALESLGVIAGMVSAMVTRASYGARS